MCATNNKNGLFVDTGYLRDHVYKLREQKKLASRLYESVAAMKQNSDPSVSYQYNAVLQDIEQLVEYFNRMARSLSEVEDHAILLHHELGELIQDDTDKLRRTVSNTFML